MSDGKREMINLLSSFTVRYDLPDRETLSFEGLVQRYTVSSFVFFKGRPLGGRVCDENRSRESQVVKLLS